MEQNLFKQATYKFNRRSTNAEYKGHILGVDLADFSKENGSNKGFILFAIDYFTRKLFTKVMKTKSEKDITLALDQIFEENNFKPKMIHSDKEAGIINNKKLKQLDIEVYHTEFLGSPIAERVIRTLKQWIEPLRTETVGRAWKPHVIPMTKKYNESNHRTINMTPNDAWLNPKKPLLSKNLEKHSSESREGLVKEYKIGDHVVVVRSKGIFEKGYTQRWDDTVYKIVSLILSNPIMYKLNNDKTYYGQQLQTASAPVAREPIVVKPKNRFITPGPVSMMTLRSGRQV
jgi:hypothetical protein